MGGRRGTVREGTGELFSGHLRSPGPVTMTKTGRSRSGRTLTRLRSRERFGESGERRRGRRPTNKYHGIHTDRPLLRPQSKLRPRTSCHRCMSTNPISVPCPRSSATPVPGPVWERGVRGGGSGDRGGLEPRTEEGVVGPRTDRVGGLTRTSKLLVDPRGSRPSHRPEG